MLCVSLLAVAYASVLVQTAHAADTTACVQAYDDAQRLRRSGKLLRARASLLTCAQSDCPAAVVRECTKWLSEVNVSIPTVVLGARSAEGMDLHDVRVRVEGETIAQQLEGQAIPLDPGPVRFEFVDAKGVTVSAQAVIREGEKNRVIVVDFPRPPPPPDGPSDPRTFRIPETVSVPVPEVASSQAGPPDTAGAGPPRGDADTSGVGAGPVVLAAVSALGLGSFVYFGLAAKSDVSDMRSGCAPHCAVDDVDSARRKALIADVSLGVSAAALCAAAVLVFRSQDAKDTTTKAALRVGPGNLWVTGSF